MNEKVVGKNPSIRVEIEGNTDNIGTAANNMKIFLKRAEDGIFHG